MYPRLFQFGSIAIPTSAVLTAVAIVAALFTAHLTARRLDLDPEKIWDLGIVAVLTMLFAPRLILVFTNWNEFLAHPLWLIGVLHVRSEVAQLSGIAVVLAAMGAFIGFTRMSFRRTLDALAPAFALGLAIASLGAFIAGSEFGVPASLPWSVVYTKRLASLWYGTPLGTPLHPVQMYAAMLEFLLFAFMLVMIGKRDTWKIRSGEIMGAWLFLHGVGSFALSFLRGDLTASAYLLPQTLAAAMALAGGLLWLL